MSLKATITASIMGERPVPVWWRVLAAPLAGIYGLVMRLRSFLYEYSILKAHHLPGRVISIGNLTVGGTGKSPVTMALAQWLTAAGAKPAILTRGYGSSLQPRDAMALLNTQVLMPPHALPRVWPDEARMQSARLPTVPVIVGRRRRQAAARFLHEHPELAPTHWLLDDGFQHRRLARDVDVVLLDAQSPLGNGWMLPYGSMREPRNALRRATVVIATRSYADTSKVNFLDGISCPVLHARFSTEVPTSTLSGQPTKVDSTTPLLLVSAIARPALIAADLRRQNYKLAGTYTADDHQPLGKANILEHLAASGAQAVVTTAKDYWRDPQVFAELPQPVLILELHLSWSVTDQDTLRGMLD